MKKTAKKEVLKKVLAPLEDTPFLNEDIVTARETKPSFFAKNKFLVFGLIFIVILVLAGGYFCLRYLQSKSLLGGTQNTQEQANEVISQVGKLMELPQEQPTIATVTDVKAQAIQSQPFFAHAKNGDKVLIYPNAKKAILYDPSENKIVEVGPINIGDQTAQAANKTQQQSATTTGSPTPTPAPVTVALYNGTTITGYTTKTQSKIQAAMPNIKVVDKENAAKSDYKTTTVIDINSTHAESATALANELGGQVAGKIPEGEKKPDNADILVILGQ